MSFNSDSTEFNSNTTSQNNPSERSDTHLENNNQDLGFKTELSSEQRNYESEEQKTVNSNNEEVREDVFHGTRSECVSPIQTHNSKIQNAVFNVDQTDLIHHFQPRINPGTDVKDAPSESSKHITLSDSSKGNVANLKLSYNCYQGNNIRLNDELTKTTNLNTANCTNTVFKLNSDYSSELDNISCHNISSESALNDGIELMDVENYSEGSNTDHLFIAEKKKCQPLKRKNNDFIDGGGKKSCYSHILSSMNTTQQTDESREEQPKSTDQKFSPTTVQKCFLEFLSTYIHRNPSLVQSCEATDSRYSVYPGEEISENTELTYVQTYQQVTEHNKHNFDLNKRCETRTGKDEQLLAHSRVSEWMETGTDNKFPGLEEDEHVKPLPSVSYNCFNDKLPNVNEISSNESHQYVEVKNKLFNIQSNSNTLESNNLKEIECLFEYKSTNAVCGPNMDVYAKDMSPENRNETDVMFPKNASLSAIEENNSGECVNSSFQNLSSPELNLNFVSNELSQFHCDRTPGSAVSVPLDTGQQENFLASNIFTQSTVEISEIENASPATFFGKNMNSAESIHSKMSCTIPKKYGSGSYCSLNNNDETDELLMDVEMAKEIQTLPYTGKNITVLRMPINQELYFQKHPNSSSTLTNNCETVKESGITEIAGLNLCESSTNSNFEIKETHLADTYLNTESDNKLLGNISGAEVSDKVENMSLDGVKADCLEKNRVKSQGYCIIGHIQKYPKRQFPETCRFQIQDSTDPIPPIFQFQSKTKDLRHEEFTQVESVKHIKLKKETEITEDDMDTNSCQDISSLKHGKINDLRHEEFTQVESVKHIELKKEAEITEDDMDTNSCQDISSLKHGERIQKLQLHNSSAKKYTKVGFNNQDRKNYLVSSCCHRELNAMDMTFFNKLQDTSLNTSRLLRVDNPLTSSRTQKTFINIEGDCCDNFVNETINSEQDNCCHSRLSSTFLKTGKACCAQIYTKKDECNANIQDLNSIQTKMIDSQREHNCSFQSNSSESNDTSSTEFCEKPTGNNKFKKYRNTKMHPMTLRNTSREPEGLASIKLIEEAIESMKGRAGFKIQDIINYIWQRDASIPFLSALHFTRIGLNEYLSTNTLRICEGKYLFVENSPKNEEIHVKRRKGDRS